MFCRWREALLVVRLARLSSSLVELPELYSAASAARNAPSWYCRNSAAKLAASMVISAKLAASMVQICQTCSKYGNPSHTWRISGSAIMTTQLGAFLAALLIQLSPK